MLEYGLSKAEDIYTSGVKDWNVFGVSIDGLWIIVLSEQRIKSFLYDAKLEIKKYNYKIVKKEPVKIKGSNLFITKRDKITINNIKIKTMYEHLPM